MLTRGQVNLYNYTVPDRQTVDQYLNLYVEGVSQMAHTITDSCLACGACAPECPVDAIAEGDPKYIIDADTCTDCGACVEVCPADCIEA